MNSNTKTIIFFGSDDFAEVHLRALLASDHKVVACVTQPDKPKDRGMKLTMSPIKVCALEHHIPVLQPEGLKGNSPIVTQLKSFEADIFVVIAYGRFLTPEILSLPKMCAVNVHGSLLPKYRGAAPINWAIINGETESGISIIKLNAGMDAGDILAQEQIVIGPDETSVTLRQRMMEKGPSLLLNILDRLPDVPSKPQQESQASFAPKLTKALGLIDWNKSALQIHYLVRGLLPWPSAYTFFNGEQLKVLKVSLIEERREKREKSSRPGEVLATSDAGILVATGTGAILIEELQLAGKKSMDAASFLRGHALSVGLVLG